MISNLDLLYAHNKFSKVEKTYVDDIYYLIDGSISASNITSMKYMLYASKDFTLDTNNVFAGMTRLQDLQGMFAESSTK